MHPGERGQAHVTGRLGLLDRELQRGGAGRRSRRPGTAPGRGSRAGRPPSAGSRAVRDVSAARPMWRTASSKRCSIRASSPSIASRRTWSHGSSTARSQCCDLIASRDARARGRRPRSRPARRRASSRPGPTAGPARRRARCCDRSAPAPGRTRRGARRRRRGSSAQRACRSTSSIASASSVAAAMCSRASSRLTGRRFDPRREQQRAGAVAARGRVAGGVERRQDPLRAAAVAEDDPGPAEPVDDAEREQRVVRRRSRPGRRRCWRARPGRRRGARPGAALRTPSVERPAAAGEPRGVRGEGALGQPGVGHRFERERADAVEQPVANGRRASSSTMTSERLASRPTTSIAADAGTSSASRTNSTAGSGAPPANVASAHRPRLSSGNSSS